MNLLKLKNLFKNYFSRTDNILWIISLLISIYCLLLLKSVSRTGDDHFTTQFIAIVLGYMGAIAISFIDYRAISKYWKFIAGFCVLIILYTLVFGSAVKGSAGIDAKAWIVLPGGITFQPSELVKIGFMITFSEHLFILKQEEKIKDFLSLVFLAVHALVPIILTHLQGDDGAAIIFFCMFIFMSFIAGVQLRYFAMLFTAIIVLLPFAWKYVLADYQKNRLISQFNPQSDPLGAGFQQIQGKISIGSGGVFGQGLFNGPRVGRDIVPIQESDFIFSVAGEELGFLGCVLIILLLLALLLRTVFVARVSCDDLGKLICFGFFGMIASQMIFNLGMCLSLLPVMGVTLPFFSAGGSSAACLYLGLGLVQNVFVNHYDTDKVEINAY